MVVNESTGRPQRTGAQTRETVSAKRGQSARSTHRARRARVAGSRPHPEWRPDLRTEFLVEHVGGVSALARALDVSKSQPSRWRTGVEVPSPEVSGRLLDLEHVVALALQAWEPEVVMDWLNATNGHLGGAKPIEVLRQHGSAPVIEALEATLSGAYA